MGESPCGKITVDSRLNIREPLAKFKGDFVRNGLKEEWSKVRRRWTRTAYKA